MLLHLEASLSTITIEQEPRPNAGDEEDGWSPKKEWRQLRLVASGHIGSIAHQRRGSSRTTCVREEWSPWTGDGLPVEDEETSDTCLPRICFQRPHCGPPMEEVETWEGWLSLNIHEFDWDSFQAGAEDGVWYNPKFKWREPLPVHGRRACTGPKGAYFGFLGTKSEARDLWIKTPCVFGDRMWIMWEKIKG